MGAQSFRSLLLAAIVLSNCITWAASRHHVHQHQARHKRQDPKPYLPASYIIPGGEGSGPWGEWGEVSSCSRTCGGGVASQKRKCLEPEPQNSCTGGNTKYFSCQTQDCPAGSGDFRAEQCAEFDDKEFHGNKYNWVPYTRTQNPCELACKPRDERFYFRHKPQVVDGTRCNDDSFDVCVNGVCKHVGCDMMLGSSAREDKCRVCRGNGTNCFTMEGFINSQDLFQGYNNLLFIPEGSMNIIIEEVEPSSNYLALRDKNGSYYLNGDYNMNFPGKIIVPGGFCSYNRIEQDFLSLDTLHCLGPTTKPLYLYLLLQDENVGIKYEFSFAVENNNPSEKQYNWVYEEYTPCSATCGGGFQTRNVTCRSREELEVVDNNLCDEGLKPPTNQSCNQDPCPAQWVAGPWGDCSKRCGSGGVRSREVTCQKVIANGIASIVPEKECFELLGPKPKLFQKCNEDAACPDWFVGHWKPCDKLCDEGKQTRQVVCRQKINGRVTVLADGNCTDEKPAVEQKCMIQPCDGVDWVTSDWSECDTCTSNSRTRKVLCLTKHHIRINDSFCSHHRRPVEQEECVGNLTQSKAQWHATEWSKCSVASGDRVQTRKVFCGVYKNESLEQMEDSNCTHLLKCKVTKPCSESEEEYPSQWFTGPWSLCSEYCGGGEQYRRVTCMRGWKEDFNCPFSNVPDSTQLCNTQPCLPEIIEIQDSSSPGEKKLQCKDSKFGCCPDNKTAAVGPFDEGCRIPRECSFSIFGCCPDGVSPKLNETDEGCPVEPCADTLFGCCLSDNKTAAQGNDQDNCPPLSPSCLSSLFGSCTNNEPEVTGDKKADYLENITTTTEGSGTLETSEGSTNGTVTTQVDSTTLDSSNYNRTKAKRLKDPVTPTPARIVGGENVLVIGELGSPLSVLCLTYGSPQPYVLWYKGYDISNALYNDDVYEARDNVLLIRSLAMDTLGQYTCQAYNGQGKAAIWTVNVRAYKPKGLFINNDMLVPRDTMSSTPKIQAPTPTESPEVHTLVFTAEEADSDGSPCSTSPHGCCEDNKTAAHGPNYEGCCLLQTFGCCPDNRKPAEGPHFEGCGCQYSLHGCCPDNVTIAQGADNQGCGCQYTQHGCCPDRHTAASGPDNEGCGCSTFQFGCCPDGVTIAKGPEQQGCHCQYSLYGCCGDGETPATGPDSAGCDCSTSKYGCCPDGITLAAGPKFLGCTDVPENKQAACSLPADPGSCHNFTAMWYFDMTYGGCSRFWYGGCEGNGNRFATKEDCMNVCVEPSPKDTCNLPSVKGPCDSSYEHWHYNSTREQCVPFLYGGCLGNANNFESRELCQKQCEPKMVEGQCDLPIEQGSCAGHFSRWGFNPDTRSCEQFIWGGCEGNANRFSTEAACQMRCNPPGSQPLPDKCTLPAETGQCSNYRERWFFDTTFKRCRQFYYGGCGGNENNFATEAECENSCFELKTTTTTTTTTTARPAEPQPQPGPQVPSRSDFCFLEIDAGPCNDMQTRVAYDSKLGRCVTFQYGGCAGNQNNFPDLEYCTFYCHPIQDKNQIAVPDCTAAQQQCEALDCQYGVARFMQDGCERCECSDDPCVRANCSSNERCVAVAVRNPAYQEPQYSATCVEETNEVDDCEEYAANCSRLRCEYNIQRTRMPNGCEKCSCVQLEVDCQPLLHECETIKCNYGIQKSIGADGCQRCSCKENPCAKKTCPPGDRCVVIPYNDGLDLVTKYTADCRTVTKPGFCPTEETTTNEVTCRHECYDDADCRGVGKCCRRGCSDLCLVTTNIK